MSARDNNAFVFIGQGPNILFTTESKKKLDLYQWRFFTGYAPCKKETGWIWKKKKTMNCMCQLRYNKLYVSKKCYMHNTTTDTLFELSGDPDARAADSSVAAPSNQEQTPYYLKPYYHLNTSRRVRAVLIMANSCPSFFTNIASVPRQGTPWVLL